MFNDPVHYENGAWWFWDETGADRFGPYPSEISAREALTAYANYLETGIIDPDFLKRANFDADE